MLVVLTGAKKNVGDFLITDRALRLIDHVLGEEVVLLPRWKPLEGQEETLEKARAIVVAGGPGVLPELYPKIFPLLKDPKKLVEMNTPVRFLGVGWFAARGDQFEFDRFQFTPESQAFLDTMGDMVSFSTRDARTARVLESRGVPATVTGCPVWYDLRHLNEPFQRPEVVRSVVYTTPQSPLYEQQSNELLARVIERFPDAQVYCTFHRGLQADEFTSAADAARFQRMAKHAEALGAEVRDVSYSLDNVAFYDDCDLHIGYRVHAHLQFLSGRRPSMLLEEDGRGSGFAELVAAPSISAWDYTWYGRSARGIWPSLPARVRKRGGIIEPAGDAIASVDAAIDDYLAGDDAPYVASATRFEETYPTMKGFIESF